MVPYWKMPKLFFVHDDSTLLQHGVFVVKLRSNGFIDSKRINVPVVAKSSEPPTIIVNKEVVVRYVK